MCDLKAWCTKYNAIERTISNFYKALKEYKAESLEYEEVFADSNLEVIPILDTIHCVFSIPEFNKERIYIDLKIQCNETDVGWYRTVYELDGKEVDDIFVIE